MVKVFGHRGTRGDGNPPENSLAAFKTAIKQGARGIELDVLLSNDQKLIVFHDDDLERMTGAKGKVAEKNLAELKHLSLGNTQEKIPTLKEVLDLVQAEGIDNFIVNIEIKKHGLASQIVQEIKDRHARGWRSNNFQVSSFNMNDLREMKRLLPEIPRGILYSGQELAQQISKTRDIEPYSINLALPLLMANNGEAVKTIKATGARPVAWTCDEKNPVLNGVLTPEAKAEAAFLTQHGIDIITYFTAQRLTALRSVQKGGQSK